MELPRTHPAPAQTRCELQATSRHIPRQQGPRWCSPIPPREWDTPNRGRVRTVADPTDPMLKLSPSPPSSSLVSKLRRFAPSGGGFFRFLLTGRASDVTGAACDWAASTASAGAGAASLQASDVTSTGGTSVGASSGTSAAVPAGGAGAASQHASETPSSGGWVDRSTVGVIVRVSGCTPAGTARLGGWWAISSSLCWQLGATVAGCGGKTGTVSIQCLVSSATSYGTLW